MGDECSCRPEGRGSCRSATMRVGKSVESLDVLKLVEASAPRRHQYMAASGAPVDSVARRRGHRRGRAGLLLTAAAGCGRVCSKRMVLVDGHGKLLATKNRMDSAAAPTLSAATEAARPSATGCCDDLDTAVFQHRLSPPDHTISRRHPSINGKFASTRQTATPPDHLVARCVSSPDRQPDFGFVR